MKRWFLVGIAGLLALLMVACGGSAQPAQPADSGAEEAKSEDTTAAEPQAEEAEAEEPAASSGGGGTVRIGYGGSPDTLNPGTAVLAEAYTMFELAYDAMFQLEFDGTFTPELAESFEVSEDGKTWTFKIRNGFMFHDGTPLTAKDIAFSYNFYQAHEDFPFLNVYTAYFESVEAPDDTTVVIRLTE